MIMVREGGGRLKLALIPVKLLTIEFVLVENLSAGSVHIGGTCGGNMVRKRCHQPDMPG